MIAQNKGKSPIEETALLPPYLSYEITGKRTYGQLSYNARRKCWTIKAEPAVTEMAKRLFPGVQGSRRGEARFTAHRRIIGDLYWFMLRFPLEVRQADQKRFEKAVEEAKNYAIQKEISRQSPLSATPPEKTFIGKLQPFQEKGLAFLLNNPRSLLADEMGLGKTVQALAWLASTEKFPAMIISPAHLVRNWEREIIKFLLVEGRAPRIHVVTGLKPYTLPSADIYIMHYLLLRGWKEALPQMGFQAVIFDEIQELRHSGTEKYSAASLLADSCQAVIGLSGTPIYNRGGEIWNIINILDFHFLGDWESFSREWCYGYGKGIVIKPQVLGEYLKNECLMLRRTKEEVLPELPPKRRLVQEIDEDELLYKRLMQPVMEKLLQWKEDDLSNQSRALLEEQISKQERQATGIAKAPYVAQFVKALLEGEEKVLLFAHHHAVMDIYKKELRMFSPVFVTGRETSAQKERAISRFMEGKTNLCCISLRAAAGLNLQRASCVVFGELDWSPAVHSQAEDRAHRIGQRDSILCYYLVSPKGSDMDMQEALGLKVSQFIGLMGDEAVSAFAMQQQASYAKYHVEQLIKRLEEKKKMAV
ncbi:MAG: DEAD/DEAH box helicase [Clostridiales bacterium]|nr:DEAD/DEAH box helicase [Clostridiales bacterium]